MRKKYRITATVYDKKGRVLSTATNSYQKTHPYQAKCAEKVGKPNKIFLHAEIHAIIKALKKGVPYKIKIERYNKKGEPVCAKPCPVCQQAIQETGIKYIEYTI
jgi:deoxycytidylate deaminase